MPDGTPLYVHVPFCEKKCHYCDFYSLPAEGLDVEGTVDAILAEARRRAPRAPRTVFLGGGTPSLLSIASLRRLLDGLEELTGFRASSCETTVECNPESLDVDKARALVDLGVDRLSIGFQSLEPETLALFGRVHDVEQSFRAYDAARSAGVPAVNVDVIFAAPGHDAATWSAALARVLALAPDHLSAYNLAFEEDTVFRRWLESGRIQRHSDARELELLAITLEQTRAAGLARYEISNYARSGRECRHNLNYWANGPYVGLGPSAVSHVDGVRAGNTKVLQRYVERARATGEARDWSEALEPAQRLGETWWLGLRTLCGVDPREARAVARFTATDDPCEARARAFASEGLLHEREGRFALTERGLPLADAVAAEFLQ
ncbi:MAG: radical SAM family heme chaperone HemW [Planctomycetes bacterium]|nr:radical SAM family heme chaperone HemW [Planctomycetota bacterium]